MGLLSQFKLFICSIVERRSCNVSIVILNLLLTLVLFSVIGVESSILKDDDQLLCANSKCTELCSEGLTNKDYNPIGKDKIFFKKDSKAEIFGKAKNGNVYLAKINNKLGYVSSRFITEKEIHKANLEFQVPASSININPESSQSMFNSIESSVEPLQMTDVSSSYIYEDKSIVIDNTVFNQDMISQLVSTTTYKSVPVTKTATILANFDGVDSNNDNHITSSKIIEKQEEFIFDKNQNQTFDSNRTNAHAESEQIISQPLPVIENQNKEENKSTETNIDETKVQNSSETIDFSETPKTIVDSSNSTLNEINSVDSSTEKDNLTNDSSNSNISNNSLPEISVGPDNDKILTKENVSLLNNESDIQNDSEKETHIPNNDQLNTKIEVVIENVNSSVEINDSNIASNIPNNSTPEMEDKGESSVEEFENVSALNNESVIQNASEIEAPISNGDQLNTNSETVIESVNSSVERNDSNIAPNIPNNSTPEIEDKVKISVKEVENVSSVNNENTPDTKTSIPVVSNEQTNSESIVSNLDTKPVSNPELEKHVQNSFETTKTDSNVQQPISNENIDNNVNSHLVDNYLQTSETNVEQQIIINKEPVINPQESLNVMNNHLHQPLNNVVHRDQVPSTPPSIESTDNLIIKKRMSNYLLRSQSSNVNVQIPDTLPNTNKVQQDTVYNSNVNPPPNPHYVKPNLDSLGSASNVNTFDNVDSKANIKTEPDTNLLNNEINSKLSLENPGIGEKKVDSEHENQSSMTDQYYPASDSLIDSSSYESSVNNNIVKRKLLAEKVGFVSVIMEIIPDEVELFFENFNVSLHAVILTSIIAFFWCLMKVLIYFISSSKKERELRDTNCQSQRKLYFFQAEKDKFKEEFTKIKERLFSHEQELHLIEKTKIQLEQENEKMKKEILVMKKENFSLKTQTESTPQIYSKLNSTLNDLEKVKQENRDYLFKIEEQEEQIASHADSIKTLEQEKETLNEEINNLNEKLNSLSEENSELEIELKNYQENFEIVHLDNKNLKELQNKLNEDLKNLKDKLLSTQEKAQNFQDENISLELQVNTNTTKLSVLTQELEEKQAEIVSMQTLLNKLNKNICKEQNRKQVFNETNGDSIDAVNGDNGDSIKSENSNAFSDELSNSDKVDEESDNSFDLQDIVKLQLRLTQIEFEKKQIEEKYEKIVEEVESIKKELNSTKVLNEQLKEDIDVASKDRLKAVTELEVLSKYYKEKELEYGKEIGVQLLKREQKEEDATSLASKLELIEEENVLVKNQLKSTKKELEESERRYKSQLNQLEKQSHENWIAARNAERKFEEAKAEATALRQTLTLSIKSPPPPNADLSLTGHLDDTASSISSLPDGLNTSLQLPPPPPPPPMSLMPLLPPMGHLPPAAQPPLFDPNDTAAAAYWSFPTVSSATTHSAPFNQPDTSKAPVSMPNYTDMSFTQGNNGPSSYTEPYSQNYSTTSNQTNMVSSQQPGSLTNINSYQYSAQPHSFNQWDDHARNTYSPMSQRSTTTPLTSMPSVTNSSVVVASSAAPVYDIQQQAQSQYMQQQQQNYSAQNADNRSTSNNPYSINNYQNNYTSQGVYQQTDSSGYNAHTAHNEAPQTNQIWTAGQQVSNPSHSSYSGYPVNQNIDSSSFGSMAPSTSNVVDSNSRPASVHTQMV